MAASRHKGTLAEIASECGVAISTVSYVLRGKQREARISTARSEQILAVAKRLDYRPNAAAVAMRRGRFNAVGLAVSEIPGRAAVFPDLLDGLLRATRARDWHLVVGMLADEQFDARGPLPRILREWSIDGLLIDYLFDFPPELAQALDEHRLPTLWLNRRRDGDCIHPDDLAAGHDATAHLLTAGHRRIAYLTGNAPGHYSHTDRRAGYTNAMTAAGLPPREVMGGHHIPRPDRVPAIIACLRQADRPTALLAYEADDALAVQTAAAAVGLNIPGDLSLIGIHDRPIDHAGLPITTWLIPAAAMAHAGLELLTQKIADPDAILAPQALPFTQTGDTTVGPLT